MDLYADPGSCSFCCGKLRLLNNRHIIENTGSRSRPIPAERGKRGVIERSSEPPFCSTHWRNGAQALPDLARERPAKFCGKRCAAGISVKLQG
jgi:hypothetical protein